MGSWLIYNLKLNHYVVNTYSNISITINDAVGMLSEPGGKILFYVNEGTSVNIISSIVYKNEIWLKVYYNNKFGYIRANKFNISDNNLMNDINDITSLLAEKAIFGDLFEDNEREKFVNINFSDIINLDSRFRNEIASILEKYMTCAYGRSCDYTTGHLDCSGLTMSIYADMGISVSWSASAQERNLIEQGGVYIYNSKSDGANSQVIFDNCQFGDLITFNGGGHVGIYVGDGYFIHSATGNGVEIRGYFFDDGYSWDSQQKIDSIVRPNWNLIK